MAEVAMTVPCDEHGPLACSFCGRARDVIEKLGGKFFVNPQTQAAAICSTCVVRAKRDELYVAACAACVLLDGKHAPLCPVGLGVA